MITQPLLQSIKTIKNCCPGAHSMDYLADYRLEKALTEQITNIIDLRYFAMRHLLYGDASCSCSTSEFGCSSFVCTDPETEHLLFARNFDTAQEQTIVLLRTTPSDGYASLGILDASWVGLTQEELEESPIHTDLSMCALFPYLTLDGVNEKGLAVSLLRLEDEPTHQRTGKPRLMYNILLRLLLDRAATVEEAISLIRQYDVHSPSAKGDYQFHIVDASGRSIAAEFIHNELHIIPSSQVTNFYLSGDLEGHGRGHDRFETIQTVLQEADEHLTTEEALSLLQKVSQNSRIKTYWSVIYDLHAFDGTVQIRGSRVLSTMQQLFTAAP